MKCIICGGKGFRNHFGGLVQCVGCGLIAAEESFGKVNVKELYNRDYFFGEEYRHYLAERTSLEKGFLDRLQHLRRFVPNGRLLEVGSAYGFFLHVAHRFFTCEGVEISPEPARYAKEKLRLRVAIGDFQKIKFGRKRFDVICMWDTIEHLQQPDIALEKASKLLKESGVLCLTTGNIDSFLPRIQKGSWRLIHPPTHLYYFSSKTLRLLLEKFGLHVVEETYPSFERSFVHILHGLGMKSRFFQRVYLMAHRHSILQMLHVRYNPHDIMFVIARKTL